MKINIPGLRFFAFKATAKVENLFRSLVEHGLGRSPIVLDLSDIKKESDLRNLLDNFLNFLLEIEINPTFPYPIYILTNLIKGHSSFSVINDVEALPKHFKITTEVYLRSKELQTLRKILILNQQLNQLPITDLLQKKQVSFSKHKDIYNLNSEIDFLININNTLPDIGILDG